MITVDEIQHWFDNGASFEEGIILYKQLPDQKSNILRSLARGKNSYNKSLLIKELRAFKTAPVKPQAKAVNKSTATTKPAQPVTDAVIDKEHKQQQYKIASEKRQANRIKYAELPPELKMRYREVRELFYQLCDLHFLLTDVPKESTKEALSIQLRMDELDEQRSVIWAELEHWDKHKTMLPKEADDFSNMDAKELIKNKQNLNSQITKMQQRIDEKYEQLAETDDTTLAIKIETSINRSEKKLHKHKLNLAKIKELLT